MGAWKRAGRSVSLAAAGALMLGLFTVMPSLLATDARAGDINVVVTIKPVHSLVAQVLEGIGKPVLLVDGQASPHAFALKPSDARALNGADAVVRVAASVEPFTVRIAETLPASTRLITLADAPGVELLTMRTGTAFEAHEHADGHGHGHGHDHDHGAARDGAGRGDQGQAQGPRDGHIWLDPGNAKAIVRHVAGVLSELRPELKTRLEENTAKAIAAIDVLDGELGGKLKPMAEKTFIVFHDAYQYFERHYGLNAAGAITLNPEVKPSARRLAEIRETLRKANVACVFAEPQFSPRIIATVIEGTAAKAGTLDPLGVDIPAGAEHYAGLMRALAQSMTDCLGP